MELQRDIYNSARDGDLYRLRAILDNSPDEEIPLLVSARTDGYTPLIVACENGHLGLAAYLIECGADVNRKSIYGMTALHECAQLGQLDILILLLQNGANVNSDSREGITPLMLACMENDYEMVKYLIEWGADVNRKCQEERTALHLCAKWGYLDILKLLLQNRASIIADSDGETPPLSAALAGHVDIVEYFMQEFNFTRQAKINVLEILGATFVDKIRNMDRALDFWRRAMDLRHEDGDFLTENFPRLPPIAACVDATEVRTSTQLEDLRLHPYGMRKQALLVRERILGSEHPVNLFYIREMGATYANDGELDRSRQLWMYAVDALPKEHPEELLAFLQDFSRMSKDTLDRGKMVTFFRILLHVFERVLEDIERETKASETEHEKSNYACFVDTLYNAVFALGLMCELQSLMTPREKLELMKAARELVLKNPVTLKDNGMTTLHVACVFETIFRPPEGYNPVEVVKLLLKVGADANALDLDYNTPLHMAAMKKSCPQDLFDTLLDYGAHLDLRNSENKTPLQLLAEADQGLDVHPLRHLNLKCLCAKAVQRHEIPYEGLVQEELEEFVYLH